MRIWRHAKQPAKGTASKMAYVARLGKNDIADQARPPSVGDEMFWGADRLEEAIAWPSQAPGAALSAARPRRLDIASSPDSDIDLVTLSVLGARQ